ncbi:hypothetical protein N7540_004251 [Penicillium herquei]|nr:hypothetical protein N7540_004251 [Penicillium herquei]
MVNKSRYILGSLGLDPYNGQSGWDLAQGRINRQNDAIRRPGRKINVMSDEQFWKWYKDWQKKIWDHQEMLAKKQEEKQLAYEEGIKPYAARIQREKEYPAEILKKLQLYHEPADENEFTQEEWDAVYEQAAPFLAKCVLAYRYGIDKDNGNLPGSDLKYYGGRTLAEYLEWRDLPVTAEEDGFEGLFDKKVRHYCSNMLKSILNYMLTCID